MLETLTFILVAIMFFFVVIKPYMMGFISNTSSGNDVFFIQ